MGQWVIDGFELLTDWLHAAAAGADFDTFRRQVLWDVHRTRILGRLVNLPWLNCRIGVPEARYRYSGQAFAPHSWTDMLVPLRERLQSKLDVAFNSVLPNLYGDGRDAMSWHSDDEPELGPEPVIASVSLGATRRFVLWRWGDHAVRQKFLLESGNLLAMRGCSQRDWQHALPRTAKPIGPRINLTFRRNLAAPG